MRKLKKVGQPDLFLWRRQTRQQHQPGL